MKPSIEERMQVLEAAMAQILLDIKELKQAPFGPIPDDGAFKPIPDSAFEAMSQSAEVSKQSVLGALKKS